MGQVLDSLQDFMQEGLEFGIVQEGWKEKIAHAREKGKLKVVLVGGFSNGKTSIAAAWLEDLNKQKMQIAHEESTGEITPYETKGCLLVDTPGLFGFKETCDTSTHSTQAYKKVTEKFVSEAHLLLYVMDPHHPIKQSHTEELKWLFKELDLLPRSVFVLGKFDEVADVGNEEYYQGMLAIKKEDVIKGLKRALDLSQEQIEGLCVVAVAANPHDKGVEYWLKNLQEFRQKSRIAHLQEATEAIIKANGGAEAIFLKAQESVLTDLLHPSLKSAQDKIKKLSTQLNKAQEQQNTIALELEQLKTRIEESRADLEGFFNEHFKRLLDQLAQTRLNDIKEFLQSEIGEEGVVLEKVIENKLKLEIELVRLEFEALQQQFKANWGDGSWNFNWGDSEFEKILETLKAVFASATFAGLFESLTSTLVSVFNLGSKATNVAKGAAVALSALTIVLEMVQTFMEKKAEVELEKFKQGLRTQLEEIQSKVLDIVAQWHTKSVLRLSKSTKN